MPHLQALHWDYQDQLMEVEFNGTGGRAYYNYDGSGQRVRKVVVKSGKRTERLYLGGVERYREYSASNTVKLERWTVQIDDIAQVDTLTVDSSGSVASPIPLIRYQYRDHLGSASLETNETGQVISYEEYHPFGTSAYRTAKSGTDLSLKRYRFTNKERDDETGLYYFGVRYYAAWLGRWTSSDPGGFVDGLNMYVYVRNNPVNGVDELGYETDPPPVCPTCPDRHTGGYKINFTDYSTHATIKSGLDGYDNIDLGHSTFSYEVTPTEKKGLTFFHTKVVTNDKGTTTKTREFYPLERYPSGITSSGGINGVFSLEDDDLSTLAKWSPDTLVTFLEEKNSFLRGNLRIIKGSHAFHEKVASGVEVLDQLNGIKSIGKSLLKSSIKKTSKGGYAGLTEQQLKDVNVYSPNGTAINPALVGTKIGNANCIGNTIAVDAALKGRAASALPDRFARPDVGEIDLTDMFGAPTKHSRIREVKSYLNAHPDGTFIVGAKASATSTSHGHVFNMINNNGVIELIDGQNRLQITDLRYIDNYLKGMNAGTWQVWKTN